MSDSDGEEGMVGGVGPGAHANPDGEPSEQVPMDEDAPDTKRKPEENPEPEADAPGPTRAVLAPGFVFADVVRKSGRDTYVVQMQGNPGFHEVHCCAQHVLAPRMNDLVNADAFAFSTGVCPSVALSLGPFCLKKHMFLNCTLQCPPNYVVRARNEAPGGGLKRRKWGAAGGVN